MNFQYSTTRGLLSVLLTISFFTSTGQDLVIDKPSVYQVNKKIEIPLTLALFASNYAGFKFLDRKQGLSHDEIISLDPDDIWWFDRIATQQSVDDRFRNSDISDNIMNATIILPFFLVLDKEIRKDWLDLLVLYGETHAINTSVYIAAAAIVDRIRPYVYNEDIPMGDKTGHGTKISFYSGHVSTTASASFFMAKVYSDYHPDWEIKNTGFLEQP